MPTTSSHTRIARAPQQKRFAAQRTFKRQKSRHSLPLLREQSTLTQIDWVRSSSHTDWEHLTEESDYSENDDSDFAEMPPRKRRRTYGRGRPMKQTTVTQNWRDFVRTSSSPPHEDDDQVCVVDSDDDGRTGQDCAGYSKTTSSGNNKNVDLDVDLDVAHGSHDVTSGAEKTGQDGTLDHAEYLLSIASSQQSRQPLHLGSSDNERASARPTPASSTKAYKTPQKPRRTVVPSSETPSSIHLSDEKTARSPCTQRSPLKELSNNVQSRKQHSRTSKQSQAHPSQLHSTQRRLTQQENEQSDALNDIKISKLDFAARRPARAGTRTLQRVTTIQDSEDDEPGDLDLIDDAVHFDPEEQQDWLAPGRPTRSLRRTTTVQESQLESEAEGLEPETTAASGLFEADNMPATYDPMFQQTFDPVSMALERDATRFGRSNTQFTAHVQSVCSSPGDLTPGRRRDMSPIALGHDQSAHGAHFVRSSQDCGDESRRPSEYREETMLRTVLTPREHASHSSLQPEAILSMAPPLCCQPTEHMVASPEGSQGPDMQLVLPPFAAIVESGEEHFERVPSSIEQDMSGHNSGDERPRLASRALESLRNSPETTIAGAWEDDQERIPQSQISTVMPTQCSRPNSAHGRPQHSEQRWNPMAFVDTLSSSPFPMPPCDDTQDLYRRNETQLTDFSLPLPPSFSSSPRQGSSL
ncbi:hypothetical protein Slin15195_G002420 [Septoria linicola]|uniref:Uncharacterized protein n=1 Tax=Septoria linicola TaxID=215465 RepID=A0A9Q9EF79_9PEZI|nr:hypothetical protein Slin14017_G002440 [Septoria linicola]USW46923.1 hypothetical protein Slin15195_G002420 [Septoria linicola]